MARRVFIPFIITIIFEEASLSMSLEVVYTSCSPKLKASTSPMLKASTKVIKLI